LQFVLLELPGPYALEIFIGVSSYYDGNIRDGQIAQSYSDQSQHVRSGHNFRDGNLGHLRENPANATITNDEGHKSTQIGERPAKRFIETNGESSNHIKDRWRKKRKGEIFSYGVSEQ